MNIFYINLRNEIRRKECLEKSFAQNQRPGWKLSRVGAETAEAAQSIPGRIQSKEKACFASHIRAIRAAEAISGHAFIAEDDILFGAHSFSVIETILSNIPDGDWDIMFTDLVLPMPGPMAEFFLLRRRLAMVNQITLVDLGKQVFAGATGYIINRLAKQKLLAAVVNHLPMDLPYDMFLRQIIHTKLFRGHVIVPFPTTVSEFADVSQVQGSHHGLADIVWNSFRRLIWLERDIGCAMKPLDIVSRDPDTEAFAQIFSAMLSQDYFER